jgi:hypothetical protein
MAPNKTISLDEDTARIADRLPNFSRFVRQCLLKYARDASMSITEYAGHTHIAPPEARIWGENKDKCNPLHARGRCPSCWGVE